MGLCPDEPMPLDGGGYYSASAIQRKVWAMWDAFWDEWVPAVTKGEPFILVHNGDAIDGVHHGSKTQVSQNHADQQTIALACLEPIVERAHAYYHIRGTEAHVGQSGEQEEMLARKLGAKADAEGNHARWELWLDLHGHLCHFSHHIGTTGSSAYESTAVYKEMVEAFVDAGRWGRKPPQVVVRSHRHRSFETRIQTSLGAGVSCVTAGWQLKTPFVHRLPGGRATQPQMGGLHIRAGDRILYTEHRVWDIERPTVEVYG